jgi:hypothetical protein
VIKTYNPKKLWDDCLEYESLIRWNTAHGIYELGGEVPITILWDACLEYESLIGWNTARGVYELGGEVPKTISSCEMSDSS